MSNPQEDFGSNPPVPGSGENGGRRGELNPELVEHRLNELEVSTKKTSEDVQDIRNSITRIEAGMITKTQLVITALALVGVSLAISGSVIAHLIIKNL